MQSLLFFDRSSSRSPRILLSVNSFSEIYHFLPPADPHTSSPLTRACSFPSRFLSVPFRCSQSLSKSHSSIQLSESTELRPKEFATCNCNILNSLYLFGIRKIVCTYMMNRHMNHLWNIMCKSEIATYFDRRKF